MYSTNIALWLLDLFICYDQQHVGYNASIRLCYSEMMNIEPAWAYLSKLQGTNTQLSASQKRHTCIHIRILASAGKQSDSCNSTSLALTPEALLICYLQWYQQAICSVDWLTRVASSQSFSFIVTAALSSGSLGGVSVKSAPTAIKLSSSALRPSSLRWERSTATSSPNLAAISSSARPKTDE